MMDHSILDEVIPQTKHPLSATYTAIQIRCSSAQNIKLNYLKFADNWMLNRIQIGIEQWWQHFCHNSTGLGNIPLLSSSTISANDLQNKVVHKLSLNCTHNNHCTVFVRHFLENIYMDLLSPKYRNQDFAQPKEVIEWSDRKRNTTNLGNKKGD
jgi:hypothetical protein